VNRAHFWFSALLALAALATPTFGQYLVEKPGLPGSAAGPPGGVSNGPGSAAGPPGGVSNGPGSAAGPPGGVSNAPASELQENVEILRRLLDGAFAGVYGVSAHKRLTGVRLYPMIGPAQLSEDGHQLTSMASVYSADAAAPLTEGVYLKDCGVVYTATLPSTGFDPLPGSKAGSGSKAPSDDWDRIRKEIRGETPEPEGRPLAGHQPLSEVILKVLAENGKHFTSLNEGERITVAITFRGAAACTACHQNPWSKEDLYKTYPGTNLAAPIPATKSSSGAPVNPNSPGAPGASQPGTGSGPSAPIESGVPLRASQETPAWVTEVRNEVLLGDLHLKQGKGQEAVAAYKTAMVHMEQGIDRKRFAESGYIAGDLPFMLAGVDLLNKLAQAYVATGDEESARRMLGTASDLAKKAEGLTGAPATTNPKSGLPAKLVVTVSKKQLDLMSDGKMTFEMFCKAATVDYVAAPADKK
jgi:hypothetical protein